MRNLDGFFFHNIENTPLFVQKLFGQSDFNMNATWIFTNDPLNIILPASRRFDRYNGLGASFSENSPFYGGFTRNASSMGFFQKGEVVSNMPHKLYLSALRRKSNPEFKNSIFWPKFSVSSFKKKLTETSFQVRKEKPHSDTDYSGQYVKSSDISFSPNNFQFHNEAHLKPSIADLKSIVIEKTKITADLKLIISAIELQHKIKSERHKILTGTDEISRKNLEHCIDTEILRTKIAYQKIALLFCRLKTNELQTSIATNNEMKSSFKSKEMKGFSSTQGGSPPQLRPDPLNIKIWTEAHKIKFQSEIKNIQRENCIDDQTIENFKTKFAGATNENLDEIYRNLQKEIYNRIKEMMEEKATRDKAKKSVMKKLERRVPIEIYDESCRDLIKEVDVLDLIKQPNITLQLRDLKEDSSMKIISELADLEDLSVFIDIGLDFLKSKPDKSKFFTDCFNKLTSESKYRILKHALESNRPDFIDALQPDKLQLFNEVLAPALEKKDANVIRFLLENPGLKYDFKAGNGLTMLHLFVEEGDIESVKILLERGANFNLTDHNKLTPLDIAIKKCEIDIMQEILKYDKNIDLNQKSAAFNLLISVRNGDLPMFNESLRYIANEKPNLSNTVKKILDIASSFAIENYRMCADLGINSNMKEITKTLLKETPIKPSPHLICLLVEMGDLELVKILLEKDVDLNLKNSAGLTPLDIAIQNNHAEMALELIKKQKITPEQLLNFLIDNNLIDFFKTVLNKIIETEVDPDLIKNLSSNLFKTGFQRINTEIIGALVESDLELEEVFMKKFSFYIMSFKNDVDSERDQDMENLAKAFNSRKKVINKLDFSDDILSTFSLPCFIGRDNESTRAQTKSSLTDRMDRFFLNLKLNNLQEVDFSKNPKLTFSYLKSFFSATLCQNLKKLNVSNTIFFSGVFSAKDFIKNINNIEELNFSNSNFVNLDKAKLTLIANHIKNTKLIKIDLSNNALSREYEYFYPFILGIMDSKTITDLNISKNYLSKQDFITNFAKNLETNNTLRKLNISSCKLPKTLDLFTQVLKKNNTLQDLNLADNFNNYLPQKEKQAFATALKDNYTLQKLTLFQELDDELRETLDRNKRISEKSKILFGEEGVGELMLGRKIKELNVTLQKSFSPEKTQEIVDIVLTNCIFIDNIKSAKVEMAMEKISIDDFPEGSPQRALITKTVNDFLTSITKKRSAESDEPSSIPRGARLGVAKRTRA